MHLQQKWSTSAIPSSIGMGEHPAIIPQQKDHYGHCPDRPAFFSVCHVMDAPEMTNI